MSLLFFDLYYIDKKQLSKRLEVRGLNWPGGMYIRSLKYEESCEPRISGERYGNNATFVFGRVSYRMNQ